jgi:hypothetical protein
MKLSTYILSPACLLIVSIFVVSCINTKDAATADSVGTITVPPALELNHDASDRPEDQVYEELTDILFRFENVALTAEFGELWNDEGYFEKVYDDTIIVKLGLSTPLSGQRYAINLDSTIQHIEIFQNYETSLSIKNEGPHLDLTAWTHYLGEWEPLIIADGGFQTAEYNDADFDVFPEVTIDEIVNAVKDASSGETNDWVELASKCKGPQGYPCGVSISRINLKLVLTYTSGITVERFIVFEVPMGC